MDPNSVSDWLSAARERAADADAVLAGRPDSIGSVYLVGYSIECCLKAYLTSIGRKAPTSGREGHNLTSLWIACGFRKADVADSTGCKTFFVDQWSTGLRYEVRLVATTQIADLVPGARHLSGWIHQQLMRAKARGRRRR